MSEKIAYPTPSFSQVKEVYRHHYNYQNWSTDYWDHDGITLYQKPENSSYSESMRPALEQWGYRSFFELLKQRQELGKPNRVLDLFGSGYEFIDTFLLDTLIGVRTTNIDAALKKSLDRRRKLHKAIDQVLTGFAELEKAGKRKIVEGNLYRITTRKIALSEAMRELKIEAVDLVTCLPGGFFYWEKVIPRGYYKIHRSINRALLAVYLPMLNRAYQLCSEDDSHLFFEIPEYGYNSELYADLEVLVKKLNQHSGIKAFSVSSGHGVNPQSDQAQWYPPLLTIRKSAGAPKNLIELLK